MIDVKAALNEWIPQVQGQYINMDWNPTNKGFGAQCWDLGAHWSDFLGLPRINTGYRGKWIGWAGNMVDAYPQTPEIEAAYELVSPDQQGISGDMPVWGDTYWYYPATHIAVLIKDNGPQLLCMSQNSTPSQAANPYPGLSSGPTTIQSLPRQGLIGYIRPRTGINYQGTTSEEDFLMALTDLEQKRILAAADRLNAAADRPHAKLLTTDGDHLDAVADRVLDREVRWHGFDGSSPTAGRTSTTLRTDLGWADARANGISAGLSAKVEALAGLLATAGGGATKEEILAQLDASVRETFEQYTPAFVKKDEGGNRE